MKTLFLILFFSMTFLSSLSSNVLENDFWVSDNNTIAYSKKSSTHILSDGSFINTWECRGQNNELQRWFQKFDKNGKRLDKNIKLAEYATDISLLPDNSIIAVYTDLAGNLFLQRFSLTGIKTGNVIQINNINPQLLDQQSMKISTSTGGNIAILWKNTFSRGYALFVQLYDNNLQLIASNIRITINAENGLSYPSTLEPISPELLWLSDDKFAVTWVNHIFLVEEPAKNDICFQIYSRDGKNIGNNVYVNQLTSSTMNDDDLKFPAIGASLNSFIITWQERQNGQWNIYFKQYDFNGTEIQGTKMANEDIVNSNQTESCIAFKTDGSFIIGWSDTRNELNHSDIYAQLFNRDGSSKGSNFQVNRLFLNTLQINPAVKINQFNNIILSWTDNRNLSSGSEIYGAVIDHSSVEFSNSIPQYLTGGDPIELKWLTQGDVITNISLLYSTNGGIDYSNQIVTKYLNSGSYSWTPVNEIQENVKIKIEGYDNQGQLLASSIYD